jgi:hypothetical protein
VSPVRYELGFYISEDDILHSHIYENLKYYTEKKCNLCCLQIVSEYREHLRSRDVSGKVSVKRLYYM